jgi:hypothetical protein
MMPRSESASKNCRRLLPGVFPRPPRPERDRVAQRDGHGADAIDPDQRDNAHLDPNPDLGRASDIADPDPDLGRGAADLDPDTVGCWRAGGRRGWGDRSPWLGATDPAGCRGERRLVDLEVAQEVGLDAQADALEADTRTATMTQLPLVLTAEAAGQRALSWPPLRDALVDLMRRWDLLAGRAVDDRRRNRSLQISSLLRELVAAVDAENEALATGRDWRLLRPRVDEAGRALSAALAGVPQQEPPAGGAPW